MKLIFGIIKYIKLIFRERERERMGEKEEKREREKEEKERARERGKLWCVVLLIDAFIGWFLFVP